jgi:hypothetical protein
VTAAGLHWNLLALGGAGLLLRIVPASRLEGSQVIIEIEDLDVATGFFLPEDLASSDDAPLILGPGRGRTKCLSLYSTSSRCGTKCLSLYSEVNRPSIAKSISHHPRLPARRGLVAVKCGLGGRCGRRGGSAWRTSRRFGIAAEIGWYYHA